MARFTLHQLDVEKPKEPFEYVANDGTVITFTDPSTRPARAVIDGLGVLRTDPTAAVRLILGEDAADEVLALPEADLYFLKGLMAAYNKHFGIPEDPGNAFASLLS